MSDKLPSISKEEAIFAATITTGTPGSPKVSLSSEERQRMINAVRGTAPRKSWADEVITRQKEKSEHQL